jgi:nitrogen fixation NifU-like protein
LPVEALAHKLNMESSYLFASAMPVEDDIYRDHILDHYEDPYHRGSLPGATHASQEKNPLCGDLVRIELRIDDAGRIVEGWFNGAGCVISQAAASMLLERLSGKTVAEVKRFSAADMLELFGARLTPIRQKCCLLGWRVVQRAIHSPVEG